MRKKIILVHLFIAAFVAPAFILVGVSGGLYLMGVKGKVTTTKIDLPVGVQLDFQASNLDADIRRLLDDLSIRHAFEYLKIRDSLVQTRPTSRSYLEFKQVGKTLSLTRNEPNLQSSMIELHKGHGPQAFKIYQKLVATGLILVVLSGLWMGLSSPAMRRKTLLTVSAGLMLFLALVFY